MVQRVELNDLPRHEPGPTVLKRCLETPPQVRDRAQIEREYDGEKFAGALARHESSGGAMTLRDMRLSEYGCVGETEWCFSENDGLYVAALTEVQDRIDTWLADAVTARAGGCRTVVELGCGYGYNFSQLIDRLPDTRFVGGDLSANALELGRRFYRDRANIDFRPVDFTADSYKLLDEAEPPVLIFTCHAVSQIASAGHLIDTLARYRDRIAGVVQFELVYEAFDDSLLGMLRKAYARACDYNMDLLGEVRRRADLVEEIVLEPNVIGANPLNPLSLLHWRFRDGGESAA